MREVDIEHIVNQLSKLSEQTKQDLSTFLDYLIREQPEHLIEQEQF